MVVTTMRRTRFAGVFQRCGMDCSARCRRHRFCFYVELGRGPDGRCRQVSGFLDAADAVAVRAKVLEVYRAGRWPAHPSMTVGEWLQVWFAAKITAGTLRPTTARCYRQQLDQYLLPRIGSVRLSRLRASDLTAMYAAIVSERAAAIAEADRQQAREDEYAVAAGRARCRVRRPPSFGPTSVVRLHGTVHAALNAAVRAGEIASNPARYAEVPRRRRSKVRPWSAQDYGVFLDYLQDTHDPMAALFRVAGHTGLRRGELCGLRWEDVDTRARVLVVRRQILDIGAGTFIGKPKTRSGEDRVVDLDVGTARMLNSLRRAQADESGYVFTGPSGGPWHPATVSHRFRRLNTLAGLPRCRFHDLRHLAASLQLAAGVDMAIVSKRLGHSTYTITADTFCHLLPGVGRTAAEAAAHMVPRRKHRPAA